MPVVVVAGVALIFVRCSLFAPTDYQLVAAAVVVAFVVIDVVAVAIVAGIVIAGVGCCRC